MSRNFPADIAAQKSLEERYIKERDSQLHWYLKKKREREAAAGGGPATEHRSRQMEVFKKKLEMAPTMSQELRAQVDKFQAQKRLKPRRDENQEVLDGISRLQGGEDDLALCVEMRPISPRTREMLYHGFSREGKGRVSYLKQRTGKAPEDKYQFPIVSSWEYGWKLGDVIKTEDIKKPPFGRTRLINDTFYTRTGVPSRQGEGALTRSKTVF